MSALRTIFNRASLRAPVLARTYGSPAANEAGKKQADNAKHGTQEIDSDHHTDSEAAVRGENDNKSIEEMQHETKEKVLKKHH
ncbi:protein of unknown function [Taphrina deformans PYCC 5710]|uniref:Uncharacterized protein n=1 Tax=Taphrina deformans (strain PYCC 5710 / ATCC 11124 / CBS 356.35 / IMI 108563 / JCM 9778 / NBRC 8474) TaxID=1097556 RepID=R4XJN6_TAPDE|nr:protein of unknown function [Taphrina deformans PYCC 5710]|eukprot:CCG84643.1 protein of unknown function [Taphrina deformans PYCC 5710]